jgi:hypothetical protein
MDAEETAALKKLGRVLPKIDLDKLAEDHPRSLHYMGILEKRFRELGIEQADLMRPHMVDGKMVKGISRAEVEKMIVDKAIWTDLDYGLLLGQREHLIGIGLLAAGITDDDVPQQQRRQRAAAGRKR